MSENLCYYCCHSADVMYGLPVSYNEHTDRFSFTGQFCSWECMKSHNLYSNVSFKHSIFNNIQLFHDKVEKNSKNIDFAPPKSILKCFGGTMTIEEFRANKSKFKVLNYPMKNEEHIVERYENFSIKTNENNTNQEYNDIINEPIKLKRKTPKPSSQNTLEKTMGLFKN